MPHGGGRKRATPRKAYAQKAAKKQQNSRGGGIGGGGGRGGGRGGYASKFGDDRGSAFSMFEAARNTEHRAGWGDKKLRNTRIEFVNATSAETSFKKATEPEDSEEERAPDGTDTTEEGSEQTERIDNARASSFSVATGGQNFAYQGHGPEPRHGDSKDTDTGGVASSVSLFFVDTKGDPSIKPKHLPKAAQIPDPDESDDVSDSSEEVVVFRGRNAPITDRQVEPRQLQEIRIVEEDIQAISLNDPSPAPRFQTSTESVEDEDIADYVANLREQEGDQVQTHVKIIGDNAVDAQHQLMADADLESFEDSGSDIVDDDSDDVDEEDDGDNDSEDDDFSQGGINSEDEAPDETQLENAAATMSDEQLARRLAKQEELGLGSSEILLWGEEDLTGMAAGDEEFSLNVLRHAAQRLSGQQSKRSKRRNKSLLPQMMDELDDLEDDYGNFDIMDFERPSLQRRGKGSKVPQFNISDSELEANMLDTWDNDRAKKKQRKVEREQLRAQGLLGGGENAKLRAKYAGGISAAEIREEIRSFLASDSAMLPLIPMDKRLRKAVHDVANRLNLRSKSKGSGFSRYPCLYKTSTTLQFDAIVVDATLRRYGSDKSAGRLKMPGKGRGQRLDKGARRAGGGGGVTSGVTYRDGETVGASAPALGMENRGHAMLAKMGWTTGTALGALDNKGSLEPVAHVVRSTKAGLG